jgi:hypothetical protein
MRRQEHESRFATPENSGQANSTVNDYGNWPIRNLKLRHSRLIMYCSLLFALGELSKNEYACPRDDGTCLKYELLEQYVSYPPLERLVRLYELNADDNLFRLLGLYSVFLTRMAEPDTRAHLANLEYDQRYDNDEFVALKVNSDAFASELARFLYARRGAWSDRYFEYIVL